MIFAKTETAIPGSYELLPRKMADARGCFVKTFHCAAFAEHGLETDWREEYYSVSHKGVLRGMHFQLPPHDHVKLVYCVSGSVLDVILDMRVGSPTFGCHAMLELSAEKANMLYIPRGLAHGFYTISESAVMIYKVSTVYAPEADAGVLWDSAGIPWPDMVPVVSARDSAFPQFAEFTANPFRYS